jgi:hypothetical protein
LTHGCAPCGRWRHPGFRACPPGRRRPFPPQRV